MTNNKTNIVIFGLTGLDTAPIVRELRKNDHFNVVAWFGLFEDATHNTYEFYRYKMDFNPRLPVPESLFRTLHSELFYFADNEIRRNEVRGHWRSVNIRYGSLYEQLDKFHRYIYLAWELFTQNQVDLFLVDSVPHCSADLILLKVAKFLDIPTLMVYPSPFPNKFFYFTEFENNAIDFDIYYTDARPIRNGLQFFPLEKREKLYYMTKLSTQPAPFDKKTFWSDLRWSPQNSSSEPHPTAYDFKRLCWDLRQAWKQHFSKRNWHALADALQLIIKFSDYKRFYDNLQALTVSPDFNAPYVYFPLHFQPELTTMCQGGQIYVNQLLALERLSALLPEDWLIYVKENPLQSELCRDDSFFQRLANIKNVRLAPTETNTFDLIDGCRFVSTISGTVGWEAIKNGKNVLLFGNMYYQSLPGVFKYRDGFNLEELLQYRINPDELQEAINQLYSRLETGIVNADSSQMLPEFDPIENAHRVIGFLERFVAENLRKNSVSPKQLAEVH